MSSYLRSDYLYPPGEDAQHSGISYPYSDGVHPQPFRHLGRTMPLEAWKNTGSSPNISPYLERRSPLTAVGYGEPTFAAFYPNCHSIFGFYDDEAPQDLNGVQYDVIGWYSDSQQDCLQSEAFLKAIETVSEALSIKKLHRCSF